MNRIIRALIYALLLFLAFGEVLKISLFTGQIRVSLLDILAIVLTIVCIGNYKKYFQRVRSQKIIREFYLFIAVSLLALIFTPLNLDLISRITSSLYIFRFFIYFQIFTAIQFLSESEIRNFSRNIYLGVIIVGILLAVFGWLQYFLYPDLRNLYYLGWDPHFKRIYSTLLDPNFLGLILSLTFILILNIPMVKVYKFTSLAFILITLLFTYSRSSYLALLTGLFLYSYRAKKLAIFIIFTLFALGLIFALPRPQGEGVRLERVLSIEKRWENWQFGIFLTVKHPLLGVGMNTLRYAKQQYRYFEENLSESHSGAGLDNSLIFVASATGLVGLYQFVRLIHAIYSNSNTFTRIFLTVIFSHSFFLNTLFYPPVLVLIWLILGVNIRRQDKSNGIL